MLRIATDLTLLHCPVQISNWPQLFGASWYDAVAMRSPGCGGVWLGSWAGLWLGAEVSIKGLFLACVLDGGSGKISALFLKALWRRGSSVSPTGGAQTVRQACPPAAVHSPSPGDFHAKNCKIMIIATPRTSCEQAQFCFNKSEIQSVIFDATRDNLDFKGPPVDDF